MAGETGDRYGPVDVVVIFDWRDGPLEGILRWRGRAACCYFKLLAECADSSDLDDRLFWIWSIPDADSAVLVREFGDEETGRLVWPVSGGLGSARARAIVDGLLSGRPGAPDRVMRTADFAEVLGWDVAPATMADG
ncbi:hypothetical protein [Streptomyces sp. HUAS TT20]|uniref:hypothetical protein n=1 Tax=Streptomyces sp. HUAS TT20 TaxID=3447509 RepID=UPI0021D9AADB|nr:hypothetical protein [Streptomyces sp. HUAS 15-9]UXY30036.1 hypothetical protein N8I87_28130 [Streptomyces sp. HUAS 15-9]